MPYDNVDIETIIRAINLNQFDWTDEWDRNWSAQPKPGTRYFAGTPRPDASAPRPDAGTPRPDAGTPRPDAGTPRPDASAPTYSLQWQPRTSTLTLWDARGGKSVRTLDDSTASRLSLLVEGKLEQQLGSKHCRSCTCRR